MKLNAAYSDVVDKSQLMVVDDNRKILNLVARVLEGAGFKDVVLTNHPDKLRPHLQSNHFDLVIMDLHMSPRSGFHLIQDVYAVCQERFIPVLIMTGDNTPGLELVAYSHGASDFIKKPLSMKEFQARIYSLLKVGALYNGSFPRLRKLESLLPGSIFEAEKSRMEILRRLAYVAEYRDNLTGMHVLRMSRLCYLLSEISGQEKSFCEAMMNASVLHDIGKIAVSDKILGKRGPLDETERRIMQSHAQIGADILERETQPNLRMAKTVALTHHEFCDGSGYPRGLLKHEIPLEGRIAAICDIFDALISPRSYKEPWPLNRAFEWLGAQAGKKLDERLVRSLLANRAKVVNLVEQYPNGVI